MTRKSSPAHATRRKFLGGAAVAAAVAAPYIRNAEAAETTTWKVQTSWPAGVGLNTFKQWASSIKEKIGLSYPIPKGKWPGQKSQIKATFEVCQKIKQS